MAKIKKKKVGRPKKVDWKEEMIAREKESKQTGYFIMAFMVLAFVAFLLIPLCQEYAYYNKEKPPKEYNFYYKGDPSDRLYED